MMKWQWPLLTITSLISYLCPFQPVTNPFFFGIHPHRSNFPSALLMMLTITFQDACQRWLNIPLSSFSNSSMAYFLPTNSLSFSVVRLRSPLLVMTCTGKDRTSYGMPSFFVWLRREHSGSDGGRRSRRTRICGLVDSANGLSVEFILGEIGAGQVSWLNQACSRYPLFSHFVFHLSFFSFSNASRGG